MLLRTDPFTRSAVHTRSLPDLIAVLGNRSTSGEIIPDPALDAHGPNSRRRSDTCKKICFSARNGSKAFPNTGARFPRIESA